MAYRLKSVSLRTDNSERGMAVIAELWQDIVSGKLPLMFDSDGGFVNGLSPVSVYSDYASDEKGEYDLTVITVTAEFFAAMERKVASGEFIKIDKSGETLTECADAAWQEVWNLSANGKMDRAYAKDYESTVPPEYTKDGKAHCILYISVK